ncbi:MAG: hypothetical protein ACXVA8_05460 [Bdellovibrionota bacterium]
MKNWLTISCFMAAVCTLIACGKLNDNFGRLHSDYTLVKFEGQRSGFEADTVLSGGMMIYIMSQNSGGTGMIAGFGNDSQANSATVAVPNGTFKIFAVGYDGTSVGSGQARCGYGASGQPVTLSGTPTTISIDMNQATCNFGSASDFAFANDFTYPSPTNFAAVKVNLCTGNPYPSCTASTSTASMKVTLIAGIGGGNQVALENPAAELTGACAPASSGVINTGMNFPIAPNIAMPVRFNFYSDASCSSGVVRTLTLMDGLKNQMATSSTSTVYVHFPAASGAASIDLYRDF